MEWVISIAVTFFFILGILFGASQNSKFSTVNYDMHTSQELCLESLPRDEECSQVWINNNELKRIGVEL